MVDIARSQVPQASFELADVRTYPSPAWSWDAVCAVFTLLTMPRPDLDATLAHLAASLARSGACSSPPSRRRRRARIAFLAQPIRPYSYAAHVLLEKLRGSAVWRSTARPEHRPPGRTDAPPEEHLVVEARAPSDP